MRKVLNSTDGLQLPIQELYDAVNEKRGRMERIMVNQVMDFIEQYDPEVGAAIKDEAARQRRNLELIASENIVSEAVMMTMGTVLTNKYAEGYSGKRYYGGC